MTENELVQQKMLEYKTFYDQLYCWYCGLGVYDGIKLHREHMIPISRGGWLLKDKVNLVDACSECNWMKWSRTVPEFRELIARRLGLPTWTFAGEVLTGKHDSRHFIGVSRLWFTGISRRRPSNLFDNEATKGIGPK